MADDRKPQLLKIDVLPSYPQYKVLLSSGCQGELEGGSVEPDAQLSVECSAEVTVLKDNPRLVRETQTLMEQCAPGQQAQQCLDAIVKNRKQVVHQTIAVKEVTDYCTDRYQGDVTNIKACQEFGGTYLDREADYGKMHGYEAARKFERGVENLTAPLKGEDVRRQFDANSMRLAYNIYKLSIQKAELDPNGDAPLTFDGAVQQTAQRLQNARDAQDTAERAKAEAKAKEAAAQRKAQEAAQAAAEAKRVADAKAKESAAKADAAELAARTKIAAEEWKKTAAALQARKEAEGRVVTVCDVLLDRYEQTKHPLLAALRLSLPPHASLYLNTLLKTELREIVHAEKNEALAFAQPSALLGRAIKDLAGKIPNTLVSDIAKIHYQALNKAEVYEQLDELGYRATTDTFIYNERFLKYTELPAEAKPLADIMMATDLWRLAQRNDNDVKEAVAVAAQWLKKADELIRVPSDQAHRQGIIAGLASPHLSLGKIDATIKALLGK